MLKYCPNGCKSQERFDKAFDDFLPPLKFHQFFATEMLEKHDDAFFH